jgi:predicted metal-dependent peptidase
MSTLPQIDIQIDIQVDIQTAIERIKQREPYGKFSTLLAEGMEALSRHFPYFSYVTRRWNVIENDKIGFAATDGPNLMLGPELFTRLTSGERLFLLAHEACHIFFLHHLRRGDRDSARWNIAADLAINDHLLRQLRMSYRDSDFLQTGCFPSMGRHSGYNAGLSAEEYYDALEYDSQDDSGVGGLANAEGGMDSLEDHPDLQPQEGQGDEQGEGESTPGERAKKLRSTLRNLKTVEEIRREMAIRQAEGDPGCGVVPEWAVQAAGMVKDKVGFDPRLHLSRFLTQTTPSGSSYERPSRRDAWARHLPRPIVLPGRRSRQSMKVALLLDTSGSMRSEWLDSSLEMVENVVTAFPHASVTLFQCDASFKEGATRTFGAFDFPLRTPGEWVGRGGTNLNPGLEHIAYNAREFQVCAVLSDMDWNYKNATDPGIPTLWLKVGDGKFSAPPFGVPLKL